MNGFDEKPIFQRELVIMWRNAVFKLTMAQNTVFKKELYCMTGFDAKPIFQPEFVII